MSRIELNRREKYLLTVLVVLLLLMVYGFGAVLTRWVSTRPHQVRLTAALALALVEWAAATGDRSPLPAARQALDFLAGCRQPGAVPAALAGLPVDLRPYTSARTSFAGVMVRRAGVFRTVVRSADWL